MGGDGGSIPKRVELVRSRQKPEQVAKEAELAARWLHCQLSQERLQRPIVACQLGRMYNKTAALELLLDRDKFVGGGGGGGAGAGADAFGHIRSLRDLRELRLADNPEYRPDDVTKGNASAYSHVSAPPFACPLSGVEMNGRFRFVFPWTCGCVLADKAIERLGGGSGACPVCQRPGAMADLVQLNPTGEAETAAAAEAMSRRRRARRQGESSSTAGKRKAGGEAAASSSTSAAAAKVSRRAPGSSSGGGGGGAAAAQHHPSGSKSSSSSIQDNPNASAALKSLFTSSKEAKAQSKAHWVTFNPGYFR